MCGDRRSSGDAGPLFYFTHASIVINSMEATRLNIRRRISGYCYRLSHGSLVLLALLVTSGCTGGDSGAESMDARIEEAITFLSLYDFDAAYGLLPDLAAEIPSGHSRWEEVTYAAAIAQWHKAPGTRLNIEAAERLLEQLLEVGPDPNRRAQYALDLGRIAEVEDFPGDVRNPQAARLRYRQALDLAQSESTEAEIRLRMVQLDMETLEAERIEVAVADLHSMLDRGFGEPWRTLIWLLLGEVHAAYALDDEAALDAFLQVDLEHFPITSRIPGFVWRRAQLSLQLERPEEAARQFQLILDEFPRSVLRSVAQDNLQQLEAGQR